MKTDEKLAETLVEVDKTLSQVVTTIDPALLKKCKTYFEKNLPQLCGKGLELTLIIDTNAVVTDALAYTKHRKSFLLDLLKSPFIKVVSPNYLKEELERKIPEVSKKQKIDENDFRAAVSILLENIVLVDRIEDRAYALASTMIGKRDEKDIQYVALYFSMKTHGILTKDKDITSLPEVKTWERPGIAGKVVSVFERGAVSFFLVGAGLPVVLRALYETCTLLLRGIWEVVTTVGTAVYALLQEGINALSKLPEWFIVTAAIVLVVWDKSREFITNILQNFVQLSIDALKWFYTAMVSILNSLAPVIEIGIASLELLFTKIEEAISTNLQLDLQMGVT